MYYTRSSSTRSARIRVALCALVVGALACSDMPAAEAPSADEARSAAEARSAVRAGSADEPWFGVMLPPGFEPHALHVISDRPAAPAVVPQGESQYRHLAGAAIQADLEAIVGFSRESEETHEVGEGQIWGRITGFPSGAKTIQWAVSEFRAAGISNVELQPFEQNEGASIWLPLSWEVRLLGDPAFGAGSADVVLESAMPLSAGDLSGSIFTASLVYVGTATSAELVNIDVRGKVAVQKAIPQGHTVFVRSPVGPRAQDLLDRGAVAVLTIIDLPGNMRARDIGCGGGTCFNIGGRDGLFHLLPTDFLHLDGDGRVFTGIIVPLIIRAHAPRNDKGDNHDYGAADQQALATHVFFQVQLHSVAVPIRASSWAAAILMSYVVRTKVLLAVIRETWASSKSRIAMAPRRYSSSARRMSACAEASTSWLMG